MPEAHSYWSASGFARDVACPGSKVLSEGLADSVGRDAAWGTVAHALADRISDGELSTPADVLDEVHLQDGFSIRVDHEMIEVVGTYLEQRAVLAEGADLTWNEQRVNYSSWLGVPEDQAWGTLDFSAYWIERQHLLIADLKTGRGVTVSVVENEQLMLYAAGKLAEMDAVGLDIETITLAIIQPRVFSEPQTWTLSRAELETWLRGTAEQAVATSIAAREQFFSTDNIDHWNQAYLRPGAHCREKFCKARATCPAYRGVVAGAVFESKPATPDEFESMNPADSAVIFDERKDDTEWLGASWKLLPLIRDWCNQVDEEVHRRLHAGEEVPGAKLVEGKRGSRAWADVTKAEDALKSMRLRDDQMYTRTVLTPPAVEKLVEKVDKDGKPKPLKEGQAKPLLSQRQWKKLKELITQEDGKPTVVAADDPRPAITVQPVADAFEVQADETDIV